MAIQVQNIKKRFKDFIALDDVSLEIKSGELIALLGPSGSGKTTLLRIISGLEFADSGHVLLDGEASHDKKMRERQVGFVFQHYALFKHMTVFDNVAFGLRVRPKEFRPSDFEIKTKVMNLLELVHLDSFYDRYPSQLSGGQQQRVALARALAVEPKVLLLDEPFGALDAKVRKELRRWMRRLHDEIHITSIFVTHDQEEAMEVSDRVVVMSNGKIEQVGTPAQVWQHPVNSFVYNFLGNYNEFDGWKDEDGNIHLAEVDLVETGSGKQSQPSNWLSRYPEIENIVTKVNKVVPFISDITSDTEEDMALPKKQKHVRKPEYTKSVKMYARPHEMLITKIPDDHEYIRAKIIHINPAGPLTKIELERSGGQILQVEVTKNIFDQFEFTKGEMVYVRPQHAKIFE